MVRWDRVKREMSANNGNALLFKPNARIRRNSVRLPFTRVFATLGKRNANDSDGRKSLLRSELLNCQLYAPARGGKDGPIWEQRAENSP